MNKFLSILTIFSLLLINSLSAQTEMLTGGNMESITPWSVSFLNTPATNPPTVIWGDVNNTPINGSGGSLYTTGMTSAGNVQYCIYQELTLTAGKKYTFDGAFNALQINNSWCEVFIGSEPIADADYTDQMGTKLAVFGSWADYTNADGVFSTDILAANYKEFVAPADGTYYFVLKMGSTSWDASEQTFEIVVDELSLLESRDKPTVDFSANYTVLFPNSPIQFTDKSLAAESWAWDFGDGSELSNDKNPIHSYTEAGIYNVKLTATNEVGETLLEKENFIIVNPAETLTGGGVLVGGDMEDASKWSFSTLDTQSGSEPIASWNDLTNLPGAGQNGAFSVTGNANTGGDVQYAIYQEVQLSADKVYKFNAAFKDLSADLKQSWIEIIVGEEPVDGLSYKVDDGKGKLIAKFSSWDPCNPKGIDGTFELNSCDNDLYIPETSGTYFFVVKIGSWEGGDFSMAIDELSLTEMDSKPIVDFSVDNKSGTFPLTVNFTDNSTFAESWDWDFGDGTAHSSDPNPSHEYTVEGVYDVTLIATNGSGSTTLTKTNYIASKYTLPEGEMIYGGNMEAEAFWNTSYLNAAYPKSVEWNYTGESLEYGQGGNLHVIGQGERHYCIWQEVQLTAGKEYYAFGALKELNNGVDGYWYWSEVLLGTTPPIDGQDYSDNQFCALTNGSGENSIGSYIAPTTGTYYFVIKLGTWGGNFDLLLDEVSLIEAPVVEADFFALSDVEGPASLDVTFMASGNATTYEWNFGDGTTGTGTMPSHTYSIPGVYTVTLVAKNGIASKTVTYTDMITITGTAPEVTAAFSADVVGGETPLVVQFTDESTGANQWAWDFGDGNTSDEKNPSHTYTAKGTYTVKLVASNSENEDTEEKVDYISTVSTVIDNTVFSDEISLYPNPTTGLVNLSLEGISDSKIEVYSISGKKILTKLQTNEEIITLNIETEGLYFVRITNENFSTTKKVIVKK